MKIDYLIVGQGIAGSAVALQALKLGRSVMVIDQPEMNSSSRIAAGLFNPVTGQNSVKTWLSNDLFPYLHDFYKEAERLTAGRFFYPLPIYKPFSSVHEQNEWMGKSADEIYFDFVDVKSKSSFAGEIHDPFGGMYLKQGGFVQMDEYLGRVRSLLIQQGAYRNAFFNESDVRIEADAIFYSDIEAKYLILCQGLKAVETKRFRPLPIRALKGETLIIKSDWRSDVIINRGVYIVPAGSGTFKIGATYKFNDFSLETTDEGRAELSSKINDLLKIPYNIMDHQVGIRPTTVDRKPILGHDPASERVIFFNGLGTKGVSLAPYFSEALIRWFESKGSLRKDVSLTRFK